ncbi:uncharacterized protein STEHIDRAFT_129836 [Stereum hirsutum FP-91666 SS1]|uniref:uncharacterized protein n=1 Tax=Stereum hirsutum (strain FP-91666) TaxID=721885 RepID=UPI000440B3A8|nr:uncharacterized protein STEHIDRAFT_129836 [Stereum hirsutum FP-91666 SS1]EIM87766.1 hypothetical protein STEHIDRAFT_129836 [Stereum hirsutum FP-91666 SS1]
MPTYVPNVMCSPHHEGRSKPPSRLVLDEPKRTTEVVGGYELGEGTEDGGCLVDESGLLRLYAFSELLTFIEQGCVVSGNFRVGW